jgi:hypothetical protein
MDQEAVWTTRHLGAFQYRTQSAHGLRCSAMSLLTVLRRRHMFWVFKSVMPRPSSSLSRQAVVQATWQLPQEHLAVPFHSVACQCG